MVTSSRIGLLLMGAALAGPVGCGSESDGTQQTSDVSASTSLEVKAPGLTVWVDPIAHPTTAYGHQVWRIDGRTSKNLEEVFSFASDDEVGEALQQSARKFTVTLDADQLGYVEAGYRLIVKLDTTTGSQRRYFISMVLGQKLERFHGSSKITLRKTLTPFLFGGETRYRNLVGVAAGYDDLAITTEQEGAGPLAIGALGTKTPVDWNLETLLGVAADRDGELIVSATQAGAGKVERFAGVDVTVSSLQITTSDAPLEVWPLPACSAQAQACVSALPPSQLDTSSCGNASQVRPCKRDLDPASLPTADVFAGHLTNWMNTWYADHGADVASSGGNTLAEAQAFISASKVEIVTDPEEDPYAHDLAKFLLFRHPDMVYPGSDIAWFGAYDRSTGGLVEIYDFN